MLREIVEMLRGDWAEKLGACVVITVTALVLWLVSWGCFVAVDSWFLDDTVGPAVVIDHEYRPAWMQTVVTTDGKTTNVQVIYWPESWHLGVTVNRAYDKVQVSRNEFDRIQNGQRIRVYYRHGRISGSLYVTKVIN